MRRRNSNVKYNHNDKEMDDQFSESEIDDEDVYIERRESHKPQRQISETTAGKGFKPLEKKGSTKPVFEV